MRGLPVWRRRRRPFDDSLSSRRETLIGGVARPPSMPIQAAELVPRDRGPLPTADTVWVLLERAREATARHRDVTVAPTHGQQAV